METYHGHVRTPADAIILFEACRLGLLPRVQRRLSEKERQSIRSGSVFVWDEREAGMRRWTDGKSWSASRVSGSFLTYREMEGKRGGNTFTPTTPAAPRAGKTPDGTGNNEGQDDDGEEGPDGYRYKPDGLMKQSFSITASTGQHLHLISYFARSHATVPGLLQPSQDPQLRSIRPQKGMYPESTIADPSNVPAVTRSPMPGAPGYGMPPNYPRPAATHPHGYMQPPYPPQGYGFPPSPMQTPPTGYPMHYPPGPHGLPPLNTGHPMGGHQQPHYPIHYQQGAPPPLDHRPLREHPMPSGLPIPPANYSANPGPPQQRPSFLSAPSSNVLPNSGRSPISPLSQERSPGPQNSGLQIDPRLMGQSPSSAAAKSAGSGMQPPSPASAEIHQQTNGDNSLTRINSLINDNSKGSNENAQPSASSGENALEHTSSNSPSDPKAEMQDIPTKKLGFREDARALRQLDKVFTM